ncbi:MAG: AprI/Inh family metalloprotease inhibitor [Xanthobacteraceae bacterium]
MRTRTLFAVVAVAAALISVAVAQPSDEIKDLAGAWEMSNADRDATCTITLRADPTPGGFKIDFDKAACTAGFPPLKDVTAWSLANDAIRLTDARGRLAFEFTEVEDGMYESLRAGQPLTFLQSAAAAQAAVRTVEQTSGDWNVVRSAGTPICTLTLMTTAAGAGDLTLQVKPGCDATVARFGPATWQMDHGELVVKSARGQVWRFEDANGAWQRVPAEADPLLLTRP